MSLQVDGCETCVSSDLQWLKPVLEAWTQRILRYATMWSTRSDGSQDAAYWYGERASISTLVGALAQNDADVLCEYGCERVREENPGRKLKGRTDLWFCLDTREAILEAKQRFPVAASEMSALLASARAEAAAQLRSVIHETPRSTTLLSAVFLVPSIPLDRTTRDTQGFLDEVTAMLSHKSTITEMSGSGYAVACCFPAVARNLRGVWASSRVFPGVVLVVHVEKRDG